MFSGRTIEELVGMVQRAEANAETKRILECEFEYAAAPAYTVYSFEQLKKFERASAFVGVA